MQDVPRFKIKVFDGYCDDPDNTIDALTKFLEQETFVEIGFHGEAPALDQTYLGETKFIDKLKEICLQTKKEHSQVKIVSGNIIERKDIWPNLEMFYDDQHFLYGQTTTPNHIKAMHLKHFALFVGVSRWPRLWLSCMLYNEHNNKSLLTFNADATNKNVDKDKMFAKCDSFNLSECFETFAKATPIRLQERPVDHYFAHTDAYTLNEFYDRFFLELITESFHSGRTFCPTEKTARPILNKTPFIVQGPKDYLRNLQQLGFKTFSQFWPEYYDSYSGYDRLKEIKSVVDTISSYSEGRLLEMLEDMQGILDHNYKTYMQLKTLDMEYRLLS
jgi:hypothetical protein